MARLVGRLIDELAGAAERYDLRPRTIYFGGGTPTLLPTSQWDRLFQALAAAGLPDATIEFTTEANPETLDAGAVEHLVAGGVNRMSIGAQSFDEGLLAALGRRHSPEAIGEAVRAARLAGVGQVGLDLMFTIPGQTMATLEADIDAALGLEPDHLGYYQLTIEPGTPLAEDVATGRIEPAGEELQRQMYARVIDRLGAAGFEHYEISNWARPGCRCRHNMTYWTGGDYLGFGPSASSYVAGQRWKNAANLDAYLAAERPPTTDHEQLQPPRRAGEQIMLRLRLIEGMERQWLKHALPADDARWSALRELIAAGLLEETATHMRLTREGVFLADAVISQLL